VENVSKTFDENWADALLSEEGSCFELLALAQEDV